ncbi:hypothetical protein RFI_03429 [Reticulomyxa filosa]|uniref:Uncharacterized protein n=1 Tax=Reticulomyxa filosa TaxID=46433 RepID=X6P6G5_RETFI|nr:hypothetical protein RFI_03429 [Reticulomyxa filosa]|eukprot:ETO33679.1 hypothetical protein RFI_03429 [Reticulomyxa filosa]
MQLLLFPQTQKTDKKQTNQQIQQNESFESQQNCIFKLFFMSKTINSKLVKRSKFSTFGVFCLRRKQKKIIKKQKYHETTAFFFSFGTKKKDCNKNNISPRRKSIH